MIRCRGIKFRDEDDAHDYFRQRELDALEADWDEAIAEDRQRAADRRAASGMSPELLFTRDAA